jgi:hypothetical protein
MTKLPLVLRELHRAETDLARDLLAFADRHRAEHEVFHVAAISLSGRRSTSVASPRSPPTTACA